MLSNQYTILKQENIDFIIRPSNKFDGLVCFSLTFYIIKCDLKQINYINYDLK